MKHKECMKMLAEDMAEGLTRAELERFYVEAKTHIFRQLTKQELETLYNSWFSPDPPIEIEE